MLQIILVILVYVLGPALLLRWVVKRHKSPQQWEFTEIVAVLFAVALIGLVMYSYSGNIARDDSRELNDIISELVVRYEFPVKAKYQDKPAVFGESRAYSLQINIYGVTDAKEQVKLQKIVEKLRRQFATKPIVLNFIREEIWQENADGSRHPQREKELSLRRIRVE